jgi:Ca2+:H+ antiporter
VPDNFLGLILVPLVEKIAEHLTAVDEAWDNQINFAIFHCLSSSVQTALFNAPLVVIVAWGLGKPFDLNFEIFMIVLVVLSILTVGQFLRDRESNWLEGALLVVSTPSEVYLSGRSDDCYSSCTSSLPWPRIIIPMLSW